MHAVIVTRDAYNSLTFQLKFALKFAWRSNVIIPHFSKSFAFILATPSPLVSEDNDTNVEIARKNVMLARMPSVYVTAKLTRLKKLCIFTLLITATFNRFSSYLALLYSLFSFRAMTMMAIRKHLNAIWLTVKLIYECNYSKKPFSNNDMDSVPID